eukprot:1160244-Pelagomonas_calceolata.AAC.11
MRIVDMPHLTNSKPRVDTQGQVHDCCDLSLLQSRDLSLLLSVLLVQCLLRTILAAKQVIDLKCSLDATHAPPDQQQAPVGVGGLRVLVL